MSDPPHPLHLGVAREELADALRVLRRAMPKRRRMPEALFSYDAGDLVLRLGGAELRIAAWGRWSGVVRAAGQAVITIDPFLLRNDPVPVHVENGRIKIGTCSILCAWQEAAPDRPVVPVDPSLLHLLRLPREHDAAAILEAGLLGVVRDALDRRDRILERAIRVLAPLEIGRADLERCLDAELDRRHGGEAGPDSDPQ